MLQQLSNIRPPPASARSFERPRREKRRSVRPYHEDVVWFVGVRERAGWLTAGSAGSRPPAWMTQRSRRSSTACSIPVSRGRVVAHIASCPDCYELVAEVVRDEEELQESSSTLAASPIGEVDDRSPSKPFWTSRHKLAAAGGLLAVAASAVLLVLDRGTQLTPLVSIVGNERLTEARPTGDFRYGPLRSPVRGSTHAENFELRAETARLRERATRTGAAEDLHASGVAQLLAGETAESPARLNQLRCRSRTTPLIAPTLARPTCRAFSRKAIKPTPRRRSTLSTKPSHSRPRSRRLRSTKRSCWNRLESSSRRVAAWNESFDRQTSRGGAKRPSATETPCSDK